MIAAVVATDANLNRSVDTGPTTSLADALVWSDLRATTCSKAVLDVIAADMMLPFAAPGQSEEPFLVMEVRVWEAR